MSKNYKNYLIKKSIKKPHTNTYYAAQGVTVIDDSIYVTYYDTKGINYSIVDVIDEKNNKTITLNNKSHVGGISYCDINKKVYISNNSYVNIYNLIDFKYENNLKEVNKFKVHDDISIASYLTVYKNNLYVGKFDKDSKLGIYEINGLDTSLVKLIDVPFKKVQGLAIYEYKDEMYYLFSCSFGRRSNSSLIVSKLVNNKFVFVDELILPCMLEQVSIYNKELVMVFESDSLYYNVNIINCAKEKIKDVLYLDINKYLKDIIK